MDKVSAVVVFILLWWWVLFMVLPFGAKASDTIELGHASSAPAHPRILMKMLITTVIASVLFIIVYIVISSGFFTLGNA